MRTIVDNEIKLTVSNCSHNAIEVLRIILISRKTADTILCEQTARVAINTNNISIGKPLLPHTQAAAVIHSNFKYIFHLLASLPEYPIIDLGVAVAGITCLKVFSAFVGLVLAREL